MSGEKRLYRTVLEKLQRLIDEGEYPPGGRLPPERELAKRFKVSRPTVREAIIALEALEQVEVKTGSGVYVLDAAQLDRGPLAMARMPRSVPLGFHGCFVAA